MQDPTSLLAVENVNILYEYTLMAYEMPGVIVTQEVVVFTLACVLCASYLEMIISK